MPRWSVRGEARRVRQVDRRGRPRARPSRPPSAPRPSACASPLKAAPPEQVEQFPTALASNTTGVARRAPTATGSPANAALAAAPARERPPGRGSRGHARRAGVAAAPAGGDADHLHERVRGPVGHRAAAARDHGTLLLARGPDPVRLEAAGRRDGERVRQRAPAGSGSSAAVAGSWPSWARPGAGGPNPGKAPRRPCRRRRSPRPCARSARRPSVARCRSWRRGPRGRRGSRRPPASGRRPRWPGSAGWRRSAAASERSRIDRDEGVPAARVPERSLRQPEQVRQRPPRTSRKRAGADAVRDAHELAGLALAAVDQRRGAPVAAREQIASQPPQNRGVTPA